MKSLAWIGCLSAVEVRDFWTSVKTRTSIRPCWEWKGALARGGYGIHRIRSRSVPAHRLAYLIAYEVDPGELSVLHACDNPKCVNARHLRPGTQAENARDRFANNVMRRGRRLASEPFTKNDYDWTKAPVVRSRNAGNCSAANPNALLTNERATSLRSAFWAGSTAADAGAAHGVSIQVAWNVICRHAYVDLPLADGEPETQGIHSSAISTRRISDARRLANQGAAA